jgi:D-alanyl-D-alanine carboxypeptidase/D-alanyl-D-alanine-endopeptidase (penicillin-binding protein 4)
VLKSWGLADDSYVIADGSGLSRYNYVSSEALVRILRRMRTDPQHVSAFSESLPIAGATGRCRERLRGTPLRAE